MWAIFGYLFVLFISILLHGLRSGKYMDVSILSFLFVSVAGYIGAFLGGQVYGKETSIGIEVLYQSTFSPVPYEVPVFPLAIVYAILWFILFSGLYMTAMFIKVRGIIGYVGIIIFSVFILILEIFNGKFDYFRVEIGMNFTQLCAVVLIWFGIWGLYRIYKTPTTSEII
jgi:prolipoprotein diacylglyceryltransferase